MTASVDEFLSYTNYISDLVMVIVVFDIIALFIMLFLEKYDPRVFVTWLIVLILLPPVGFILYMYMGSTIYNRRKFIPKNINDKNLMLAFERQGDVLESDLSCRPGMEAEYALALSMRNAGAWMYTNDNSVVLYTEGNDKMSALFEDLRSARKSILMEYYIIRNDRVGNILMDILTQKVAEGVEVRLLTDGFGIGKGPKEGIFRFRNAGGHYAMFHSSLNLMLSPKKNNRNHRKIAIIDGRVAYCGGFNIGDEYQGEGPLGHWRDATVRVVGSGIVPMAVRFCADWQYSAPRDRMRPLEHYLDLERGQAGGGVRMQLVDGGPDTMPNNPIQMQYLAMMTRAKRRLYIATPYLVPDDAMMLALGNAARSGVDVRILLPDKKDHMFVYWNNLTYSDELVRMGVRVWRYNDGFIHEKLVLMDDCCSVGSANVDRRAFSLNFETNVMMYSKEVSDQAANQFLRDLEVSTEYLPEHALNRPLMVRVRMAISRHLILLA